MVSGRCLEGVLNRSGSSFNSVKGVRRCMESVWKVSEKGLIGILKGFERYLEGFWMLTKRCLESVIKLSGRRLEGIKLRHIKREQVRSWQFKSRQGKLCQESRIGHVRTCQVGGSKIPKFLLLISNKANPIPFGYRNHHVKFFCWKTTGSAAARYPIFQ